MPGFGGGVWSAFGNRTGAGEVGFSPNPSPGGDCVAFVSRTGPKPNYIWIIRKIIFTYHRIELRLLACALFESRQVCCRQLKLITVNFLHWSLILTVQFLDLTFVSFIIFVELCNSYLLLGAFAFVLSNFFLRWNFESFCFGGKTLIFSSEAFSLGSFNGQFPVSFFQLLFKPVCFDHYLRKLMTLSLQSIVEVKPDLSKCGRSTDNELLNLMTHV